MLIIRCAYCKEKLYRYDKIGPGQVLRCHKERIDRVFNAPLIEDGMVKCPRCKKDFARHTKTCYEMIREGFTYTGT